MNFPEILVLGATGRIGTILRRCWPDTLPDARILWQGRRPVPPISGAKQALNWAIFDPLSDRAALDRAAQMGIQAGTQAGTTPGKSVILCLAGVVPGRVTGATLDHNVTLARAALAAGARAKARVILVSSAAVYGDQSGLLSENTPLRPISDYGRAKARMEQAGTKANAETGVETCCLRIGNIAGIDSVLGGWRPGFGLDRFDNGQGPRRSYIGMRTLARVLGDVLAAPHLPPVLNIAAPGLVDMGALLTAAGLDWTPRTPAPDAIPQVELDTRALERISPLDPGESQPGEMVAQWRALMPPGTQSQ